MDYWLRDGPLIELYPSGISINELRTTLTHYGELQQNWSNIPVVGELPLDNLNKLQLVPLVLVGKEEIDHCGSLRTMVVLALDQPITFSCRCQFQLNKPGDGYGILQVLCGFLCSCGRYAILV